MLNSSVSSSGDLVLIDTWWNVNMLAIAELVSTFCFNRYMVECKFKLVSSKNLHDSVLIDTWWNVNDIFT